MKLNQITKNYTIGIIGLGYVGLPLALEFGKKFLVVGYDINKNRINELKNNFDSNDANGKKKFNANRAQFTNNINDLKKSNFIIVTVPTPIKVNKKPDLKYINQACKDVAKIINKNDIVVFESTVYPGLTEDHCVPIIEKISRLTYLKDFFVGYSPERINPGDKKRTIRNIVKIVAGCDSKTTKIINDIYKKIIDAGTYVVSSIKIAESAKVIENTQRDLNIALINELAIIFNKLNIDTKEIIDAASSKWNFQKFYPGLVGGHCIGVDPYYLTHLAKKINLNPKIITSGRKLNDNMHIYIKKKFLKKIKEKGINKKNLRILIMGYTFKENCNDIRNTRILNLYKSLSQNYNTYVYDPLVIKNQNNIKNVKFIKSLKSKKFDAVIITLKHDVFKKITIQNLKKILFKKNVIYDLKGLYNKKEVDLTL